MAIDERIPAMTDQELSRLHDNVLRLKDAGVVAQRNEAERVLPLIVAELAERKARAPARAPRKTAAPKTAAKKKKA